ncbi:PREDICTED: protein spaetzle-like [Wasmannia auropunctata]|uniref:protein spaetzle-like n=1 Tax=Wasmannia auropunctata TaxID=64793 RepID=UPI0005F0213F|nr:PREDICTED: protein spaetzle-like [Wasmannia auropunctata]
MTPCARSRWIACLVALILACQTARPIEGYPHSPNTGSPQDTTFSVSELIEKAYNDNVFLRPQQSPWRTDHEDHQGIEQDTSKRQESSSVRTMQIPQKRELLQVSSPDFSTYRNAGVSTHRNVGVSSHRHTDEFVFPDPVDGRIPSTTAQMSVVPTSACRRSTFCENVADYPKQLVNAAIARNVSLRFLDNVDPSIIGQRIDGAPEELMLCQVENQVVYPQQAQNKEKQWLFIVNQEDLRQGIRIEVCLNKGQACNVVDGFAEGYKTFCKQKYIYRELAAVATDGNIVKDHFRFPSSCCCHVRFVGDPTARLGAGQDLPNNRTQYSQYN